MKYHFLIFFLLITITGFSQDAHPSPSSYDSVLAKKLGADDYGMKKYVFAFLRSGKTKIKDRNERARIQMAHLKNIQRLASEGKLVVAGPFLDDQDIRGIFIFNVTDIREARKLINTDPAVQAGLLEMELHPWYGSAALMAILGIHRKIEKKNITE
jgi:uncharacterized protein YciI